MFVVAAILTTIFLGGWNSPFGDFMQGPWWGVFWFIAKSFSVVLVQIWIRWTLPRFRYDQLQMLGWKVLMPLALANIFISAIIVVVRGM